jgi:hypothetical protein
MPVIDGAGMIAVIAPGNEAVPPGVVTATSTAIPVMGSVGMVAVIVKSSTTIRFAASMPSTVSELAPVSPEPKNTNVVPAAT